MFQAGVAFLACILPVAAGTWTTVNESNVWGDDYTNPHVTKDKDAKGKGPAACQAACTADAACHSYVYADRRL